VPVDEHVSLQWNLNQTEQRECSTLLFARVLREDQRRLWISKSTRDYKDIILYYRPLKYNYNDKHRHMGRCYHQEGYNCGT
jgi:hypothetical protein